METDVAQHSLRLTQSKRAQHRVRGVGAECVLAAESRQWRNEVENGRLRMLGICAGINSPSNTSPPSINLVFTVRSVLRSDMDDLTAHLQ